MSACSCRCPRKSGYLISVTGQITDGAKFAEAIAAHAVVGCVTSVTGGGKCGSVALAAGFSKAALPWTVGMSPEMGTAISAVVGGTASALGGGKFANGAVTGAYSYIFNFLVHVWDPSPGRGQIGHVMVTADDGTVVESQFPNNHRPLGDNETLSLGGTVIAEGRAPDHIYYVENGTNESKAISIGQEEQAKKIWSLVQLSPDMTNCSVAATNVLSAANVSFHQCNFEHAF